ncbi:MAG: alpha-glucosidase C-terminal domain-containing protein [Candidatus Kapabacteria bacterium]|nr:alpha-glucosidase C-terminal domain-containing protein [Candidatus Kapabacteria bacterium]
MKENNLNRLEARLLEIKNSNSFDYEYFIPEVWLEPTRTQNISKININPADFFLKAIEKIKELSSNKFNLSADWSNEAVIYNMLTRFTTAFDNDGDGKINIPLGKNSWRETGTFLKSIALLPYIFSLGCNTVYMLPITSIGIDGKKGNLGSPYAIKNPYKLDSNLSEPILEMSVEEEFAAFVEAAHLLGMKVVTEFVFRTASIDSDLAYENPKWFYWIKESIPNRTKPDDENSYGPPIFSDIDLEKIKAKVEMKDFDNLIPPSNVYKNMFTEAPETTFYDKEKLRGKLKNGEIVKIPSAFADWPPNDVQPVWSDVTYLKLYNHKDFNYIAYNTVRMYDTKLAKKENIVKDLWESITEIIPYYQNNFGIDGVMIDMGHALPSELRAEIINKARKNNKNFVFWEENFVLSKKSVEDGYNASLGFLPFDQHSPQKMNTLIYQMSTEGSPIPFFLTPESHNTPRAASRKGADEFSKIAWAVNSFLPGLLFIHSGFELCEINPVNTGLGFTQEDQQKYPPEKLALFSSLSLNWTNEKNIINFIRKISDIRSKYFKNFKDNYSPKTLIHLKASDPDIIAYMRISETFKLLIMCNLSSVNKGNISLELNDVNKIEDLLSETKYKTKDNKLILSLKPFQIIIGECS